MDKEYPQVLKTKEDYEYVRKNFPREYWEKDFEELLSSGYEYKCKGILPNDGTDWLKVHEVNAVIHTISEDKINKLFSHQEEWETNEIDFDTTIVFWNKNYYLLEFVVDPNSRTAKIGYTTDELIEILFPLDEQIPISTENYDNIDVDSMTDEEVEAALRKMIDAEGETETDGRKETGTTEE